MKQNNHPIVMMWTVLILAALACSLPSALSNQSPEVAPATEAPPLLPISSPTTQPEPSEEPSPIPQVQAIETELPPTEIPAQCTVLQDLNVRSGPGLAYHTPIGFVKKDIVVTPTSYYPKGTPGGTWALIESGEEYPAGWIAAGDSFITCNFDLNTLPAVQVDAPPPPRPPSAASSNVEGNCLPEDEYQCKVDVDSNYLIRFRLFKNGKQVTEENGIAKVIFVVTKNGQNGPEVYRHVEKNAPYCIFGGGNGCNTWTIQDGFYYLWPGGPQLESGKFFIDIQAKDKDGGTLARWAADFKIELP